MPEDGQSHFVKAENMIEDSEQREGAVAKRRSIEATRAVVYDCHASTFKEGDPTRRLGILYEVLLAGRRPLILSCRILCWRLTRLVALVSKEG